MMEQKLLEQIVGQVLAAMSNAEQGEQAEKGIPVGVSNRHIHLSAEHVDTLFGSGYTLTKDKDLKQVGEFAAKETVTLVGPKGVMRGVRVLGPVRTFTQLEIARTDGFSLGVVPPLRDSGKIQGSPGIVIVGPKGAVTLTEGVICAARHIHMQEADARQLNVADGDRVTVTVNGPRGGTFANVLVRVNPDFRLEFHIDTDEANAAELKNGDRVTLAAVGEK
ncbi:MAG TPA: phosphate propanoyltransferase [Sporomusa sp.]|nr:phosphate propanoyltransferase [Sporomusa sp.]HWR08466.1 phosphate propanoyltransferase [Sporomusa sp.]